MNQQKGISVFKPEDVVQAGYIRGALENSNTICHVDNENFASIRMGGFGIGATGLSIMVPENQAQQADEIIKELMP